MAKLELFRLKDICNIFNAEKMEQARMVGLVCLSDCLVYPKVYNPQTHRVFRTQLTQASKSGWCLMPKSLFEVKISYLELILNARIYWDILTHNSKGKRCSIAMGAINKLPVRDLNPEVSVYSDYLLNFINAKTNTVVASDVYAETRRLRLLEIRDAIADQMLSPSLFLKYGVDVFGDWSALCKSLFIDSKTDWNKVLPSIGESLMDSNNAIGNSIKLFRLYRAEIEQSILVSYVED